MSGKYAIFFIKASSLGSKFSGIINFSFDFPFLLFSVLYFAFFIILDALA